MWGQAFFGEAFHDRQKARLAEVFFAAMSTQDKSGATFHMPGHPMTMLHRHSRMFAANAASRGNSHQRTTQITVDRKRLRDGQHEQSRDEDELPEHWQRDSGDSDTFMGKYRTSLLRV